MRTPEQVAAAMLAMARIDRHDLAHDLGAGDGRIEMLAANRYGARAVGVDCPG